MPPFEATRVPARVTAPDVADDGVRPVVPPEIDVTATLESVDHAGATPIPPEVKTEPTATSARRDRADVVDAYSKSPTV